MLRRASCALDEDRTLPGVSPTFQPHTFQPLYLEQLQDLAQILD